MKLNIGCGECPIDGYVNIDDMSDFGDGKLKMVEHIIDIMIDCEFEDMILFEMNGDNMSFPDEFFDEVFSNQVIDIYVKLDDTIRVLKKGGKIILGVWNHRIVSVIGRLIQLGIEDIRVEAHNGPYDDTDLEDEEEYWTIMITGVKA